MRYGGEISGYDGKMRNRQGSERPLQGSGVARLRRMAARLENFDPEAPIPPPLPLGRVVDVPGRGEMFVREAPGRPGAPTILLLHGWTVSADLNWFQVYETAQRFGHVVAVDHRGHGRGLRTEKRFSLEDGADDAAGVLEHLGLGPAVVVGYSMGGPISMLLWRRHPSLVRALVLQATALEWRASLRERLLWKTMAAMEFGLRLGAPNGIIERALREAIEQCPELRPHRAWLKGELRRGDPSSLADAGRALGNYDARPFAGEVDVPTVVVVTTKDRLVRPQKQRALAKAVPGARVLELPGDHDAALVLPDAFRRTTADALSMVVEAGPPCAPRRSAHRGEAARRSPA